MSIFYCPHCNNTIYIIVQKPGENPKPRIPRKKYGQYKHVFLTQEEHDSLIEKFGVQGTNAWIRKMDEGIELRGYKYNNHYLAILKWEKKDKAKKIVPGSWNEDANS